MKNIIHTQLNNGGHIAKSNLRLLCIAVVTKYSKNIGCDSDLLMTDIYALDIYDIYALELQIRLIPHFPKSFSYITTSA